MTITTPADATTVAFGDNVTFSGSALDAEDGDISSSLVWTSDVDGGLGGGTIIATTTLSPGAHTISASVTDSGGRSASGSIGLVVTAPQLEVTVSAAPDPVDDKQTVTVTVSVNDDVGAVSGASVAVVFETPDGNIYEDSQLTDGAGVATFTRKINARRDGDGLYTVDATASKAGFIEGMQQITFFVSP